MNHSLPPIDNDDLIDWHNRDNPVRPFGCWPLVAAMIASLAAVVGYLTLVGIAVASVLYGLGYIG